MAWTNQITAATPDWDLLDLLRKQIHEEGVAPVAVGGSLGFAEGADGFEADALVAGLCLLVEGKPPARS